MFTPEEIAAVEEAAQGYACGDFIGPNFGRRPAALLFGVLQKMRATSSVRCCDGHGVVDHPTLGYVPCHRVCAQPDVAFSPRTNQRCPRCNGAGVVGGMFFGYMDAPLIPEPSAYEQRPCPVCAQPDPPGLLDGPDPADAS